MSPSQPRPKNFTFMVLWLVFLGFWQILFAWRFGSFFEGVDGDLRHKYGAAAMEPLYALVGVLALVVAWGAWRYRPWAYTLAWVFQISIIAVIAAGIIIKIAGKPAPIWWLLLDLAFGAFNVYFLTRPEVKAVFREQHAQAAPPASSGVTR